MLTNSVRIAVTGGAGFLGSHLLPLLLVENMQISCLLRPQSRHRNFPKGIGTVIGDCLHPETLPHFLEGQDVLIHMASVLFAPSWQAYLESNSRICSNLLTALESLPAAARPSKVIFVSSLAAAGPCGVSPGISEKDEALPVSAYGWSKYVCEKALESVLGKRLVILRPPIIYGSGDRGLLPLFKSAAKGFGISPGLGRKFPVSLIHAQDAARAILLLLKNEATGIYHVDDGKEHDMDEFCQAMGKALGRKAVKMLHMPLAAMGISASFASGWANLAHKTCRLAGWRNPPMPQWNLDKYREARQAGWLADASRIRENLGFKAALDLGSGMREAVEGYRRAGLL